jgi:hypothetical protein
MGIIGFGGIHYSNMGFSIHNLGLDFDFAQCYGVGSFGVGGSYVKVEALEYYFVMLGYVPAGILFFEQLNSRCELFGFDFGLAMSAPPPKFSSKVVTNLIEFIYMVIKVYAEGKLSGWNDVHEWAEENKQVFEDMFPVVPKFGRLSLYFPTAVKVSLPESNFIQAVSRPYFPGCPYELEQIKLSFLPELYGPLELSDWLEDVSGLDLNLSWADMIVHMFKAIHTLVLIAKGEPNQVIELVPDPLRDIHVPFKVKGFAEIDGRFKIVPDVIEEVKEEVNGVREFVRFDKLASYVTNNAAPIDEVAKEVADPVLAGFDFEDDEKHQYKGTIKDTFVNITEIIEDAQQLKTKFLGSEGSDDGGEFDENRVFAAQINYLTADNDAAFRPSSVYEASTLYAHLDNDRVSSIRLFGLSEEVSFKNEETGVTYFHDRAYPYYSTMTMVCDKDGNSLDSATAAANLSVKEAGLKGAAAALETKLATVKESLKDLKSQQESTLEKIENLQIVREEQKDSEKSATTSEIGRNRTLLAAMETNIEAVSANLITLEIELDKASADLNKTTGEKTQAEERALAGSSVDGLLLVSLSNHIEMKNRKLVLTFDGIVKDYKNGDIIYKATIPDQVVYDFSSERFSNNASVIGWKVSHTVGSDSRGTVEFTDYGTMKIEAPLTVITQRYGNSKLSKIRDVIDLTSNLPVFDKDTSSFLLANKFWYDIQRGGMKVQEKRVYGSQLRCVVTRPSSKSSQVPLEEDIVPESEEDSDDPVYLNPDPNGPDMGPDGPAMVCSGAPGSPTVNGGAPEVQGASASPPAEDARELPMDINLDLEDVSYMNDEDETGPNTNGPKLSINSDINRFYEMDKMLLAQPFDVSIGTSLNSEQTQKESVKVKDILILDGSDRMKELFAMRDGENLSSAENLFTRYDELGLNFNFEPVRINRASVSVNDDFLHTVLRPNLVTVFNDNTGVEILHVDRNNKDDLLRLSTMGPYGDPSVYPQKADWFFVDCRGLSSAQTTLLTSNSADLLEIFRQNLVLREVDIVEPKGLFDGGNWQGISYKNHMESKGSEMWSGGLKVDNTEDENDPATKDGIHRFLQEGEHIVSYFKTPSGKKVKFFRQPGGTPKAEIERNPGEWVGASFDYDDETGFPTGSIRYPTGKITSGGIFVSSILDLGNSSALRGRIEFNGEIRTSGHFHAEGSNDIWILSKKMGGSRFIIDSHTGLYIMGDIDTGLMKVYMEGRLSKDSFNLIGYLDARVNGLIGVQGMVCINPQALEIRGDVYLGGRKIFHGLISVRDGEFQFQWSQSAGRAEIHLNVVFKVQRTQTLVPYNFSVKGFGYIRVDLPSPLSNVCEGVTVDIDSQGQARFKVSRVTVKLDIANCRIAVDW